MSEAYPLQWPAWAILAALWVVGCAPEGAPAQPATEIDTQPATEIDTTPVQPPKTPEEKAVELAEGKRRADTNINWIHIGISTSKFTEYLYTGVYRTYAECAAVQDGEKNQCVPVAKLPQSYWNAP